MRAPQAPHELVEPRRSRERVALVDVAVSSDLFVATRAVWDLNKGTPLGLIEGGTVIKGQLIATAGTWVFAAVVSVILLKVIDVTIGLRVTPEEEVEGLDVTQHGEEGYIF